MSAIGSNALFIGLPVVRGRLGTFDQTRNLADPEGDPSRSSLRLALAMQTGPPYDELFCRPPGRMRSVRGRTSDFTTVAHRYDATRHVPESVLAQCYEMLSKHRILPPTGTVLDAGCGTGQMSIPLAKRGLAVVGIDVSAAMVRIANAKVESGQDARYEVGDVRSVGYSDHTFEGAVFSKLLMHIEEWKEVCRELVRVTKAGACIAQIMDRGFFGNSVRRDFARRATELGFTGRFPGAPSSSPLIPRFMESLGCEISSVKSDHLRWDHSITRGEALETIRERLFAEFWSMPVEVYDRVLAETSKWAAGQPGGLHEPEYLTPYLSVEVYRTPPATSRSDPPLERPN